MSQRFRIYGGGTYETRNKVYEMDGEMFGLLKEYAMQGEMQLHNTFHEGLSCGRIVEVTENPRYNSDTEPCNLNKIDGGVDGTRAIHTPLECVTC